MRKLTKPIIFLVAVMLILSGCTKTPDGNTGSETAEPSGTGTESAGEDVTLTDVGTPRNQTLIVDMFGNAADPMAMNPYLESCVPLSAGLHQLVFTHLWEIDMAEGKMVPALAADYPEDISGNYTKFRFHIREGINWSDGVELTAEDVQFTSDMIINNPNLTYNAYYTSIIKKMTAVDKYTIEVEMVNPEMRLTDKLGSGYTSNFKVVPKHIWEKEDPTTFLNTECISCGPYTVADRDETNGSWFLYEKRDDWQNTDVGQIVGEPGPEYILFKNYGTEEKRVMAAINHDLDILYDITPESWEILKSKSDTARAWYENFPYANLEDCCARGISFNCMVAPYDNEDVRWALALATDIQSVSMSTFSGMLRVTPINAPPIQSLTDAYIKPMLDWLNAFELDDGYKPFDDSYAASMVQILEQQGIEGLPETEEDMKTVFGYGWWKYDTAEATKLLEANGFTLKDGKWMLPDGTPWTIVMNAPADFEIESMRLAFAVADSWKKFGIDVQVKQLDNATFWNAESIGDFETGAYWPACGNKVDTVADMTGWDSKYISPIGEPSNGGSAAAVRYSSPNIDEYFSELATIDPVDPMMVETMTNIYKELVKGIPFLPMFGTSKFVPTDTYYFDGYPDAENPYNGPWWWWANFKYDTPNIQPTGNN